MLCLQIPFVLLVFNSNVFLGNTENTWLQPTLHIPNISIANQITLSCYVPISSDTPAPKKVYLETHNNSTLSARITFFTRHSTDESCTRSMSVEVKQNRYIHGINRYVFSHNRFIDGVCYIDRNGIPSREVHITISPITEFDLTQWRCVVIGSNDMVYISPDHQGDLLMPYGDYYHLSQYNYSQDFDLQLIVDKNRNMMSPEHGYLPLSCTLKNKKYFHTPDVKTYPYQPWKSFKIKMKKGNVSYGIETDMYGRINEEVAIHWDSANNSRCALSSQYETSCLNEFYMREYNKFPNILQDSTQCFNFTLIVAPYALDGYKTTSEATYIRTLFDFGHTFDEYCVFQNGSFNFSQDCMSYPKTPAVILEIKDKVIVELPSVSNYHCFPIFTTHTPYVIRSLEYGFHIKNKSIHQISICPDAPLYLDLYTAVIDSMRSFRYMQVKYIDQPSSTDVPRTTLSCGNDSWAKLIYISSGSCDYNSSAWCGESANQGYYSVKSVFLKNGAVKIIEKKPNANNEKRHLMTCLWKMYFCFTGIRIGNQAPSEIVFVKNKSQNEYKQNVMVKYTGYNISPNECPYGEWNYKGEKPINLGTSHHFRLKNEMSPMFIRKKYINVAIIINSLTRGLNDYIKLYKTDIDGNFLHVKNNVPLSLLMDSCPCRTRPTVCLSDTLGNDLFSTNILFSQLGTIDHSDTTIWCEAFDQKSKDYTISELIIEYLCTEDVPDYGLGHALRLLPKPYIQVYPYLDSTEHIIISCSGIPNVCLQTATPSFSLVFWNKDDTSITSKVTILIYGPYSRLCIMNNTRWRCFSDPDFGEYPVSFLPDNNVSWPQTSLAFNHSFLTNVTHMKCSYGFSESMTYNISSELQKITEICTKHDYSINISKGSNKIIVCAVQYSLNEGVCSIPSVKLEVIENNTLRQSLTCVPLTSNHTPSCSFEPNKKYVAAVIVSNHTFTSDTNVSCTFLGTKVGQQYLKFKNIPTKCINPPTYFIPSIAIDESANSSVTVTCKYPEVYDDTCYSTSFSEVELIMEVSSMFIKRKKMVIAKRSVGNNNSITCASPFIEDIKCIIENPPNDTLLKVSIPYSFYHFMHIADNPSPNIEVYCSLLDHKIRSKIKSMEVTLMKLKELLRIDDKSDLKEIVNVTDNNLISKKPPKFLDIIIQISLISFLLVVITMYILLFLRKRQKMKGKYVINPSKVNTRTNVIDNESLL